MKEYILKGDPVEVEKVIRENRIRISRGVISFTPAEPDCSPDFDNARNQKGSPDTKDDKTVDAMDFKEVNLDSDTKDVRDTDTKETPIEDVKEADTPKQSSRSKKKAD